MSDARGSNDLPEAGEVIGEKYRILRTVGQGGVGVVFEAEHLRLERRVAIKMILPHMSAVPEVVQRFEREARATAKLRSAHVARVFDVDRLAAGTPYIVMEFLNGRDLTSELKDRGPLPIPEAVDLVLQACAAMSEAHRAGIVHRDLKPANLFLNTEGGRRILKSARAAASAPITSVTPALAPPAVDSASSAPAGSARTLAKTKRDPPLRVREPPPPTPETVPSPPRPPRPALPSDANPIHL